MIHSETRKQFLGYFVFLTINGVPHFAPISACGNLKIAQERSDGIHFQFNAYLSILDPLNTSMH